jgi:choline dehydrogenase-like flavoprotein
VADSLLASNPVLSHPPLSFAKTKTIYTVPQTELLGKIEVVSEGVALGGKTRINGGLYLPGCPAEYDSWGKGWQWDDVAPYFARSEGRLELKAGLKSQIKAKEGGEWQTRVVRAEFESSRRYPALYCL